MTMNITFTESAITYINKMLAKNNGIGFRLSVKKTGCSGFAYYPTIINDAIEDDITIESNGMKIFIDAKWVHLLQEIKVDYLEEEKTGLKQKRLIFTNPNEASRCGCGESFHVE